MVHKLLKYSTNFSEHKYHSFYLKNCLANTIQISAIAIVILLSRTQSISDTKRHYCTSSSFISFDVDIDFPSFFSASMEIGNISIFGLNTVACGIGSEVEFAIVFVFM